MSLVTSLPSKLGDQFYTGVLLLFIPQAKPHFWLPDLTHHCFPNLIHFSPSSPLNTPAVDLSLASHDIAVFPISVHGSPALYRAHEAWSHNSRQLTVLFLSIFLTLSPSWSSARSVIWVALEFYGFHSPRCDLLNFDQSPLGNIITIVVSVMTVHTVFHTLLIRETVSSCEQGMIMITQEELTKLPERRISTECKSAPWLVRLSPMSPSCPPPLHAGTVSPHHRSFPTVRQIFLKSIMKRLALVASISPMATALSRHSLTYRQGFSTPQAAFMERLYYYLRSRGWVSLSKSQTVPFFFFFCKLQGLPYSYSSYCSVKPVTNAR